MSNLIMKRVKRYMRVSTCSSVIKELSAASSVEETVLLQHSDGMKSVPYCAIRIQTTRVFGIVWSGALSDMYVAITRLCLVSSVT
jgi:hypothetical protein